MTEQKLHERFEKAIGTYSNSLTKSIADDCTRIAKEYANQALDLAGVSCWVAVDEKLPESDEPYLTIDQFGYMAVCGIYNGSWYPKLDGSYPNFNSETITHWRELPEPPCI